MNNRYWLHVDPAEQTAHLLAFAANDGAPARDATGFVFRNIPDPIELTSHVLDLSHGDADAILMGQEMLGNDDPWLEIDAATFDAAARMGDIAGSQRETLPQTQIMPGQLLAGAAIVIPPAVL